MREFNWDVVRDLITAGRLMGATIVEVRPKHDASGPVDNVGFSREGFTVLWTQTEPEHYGQRTTTFNGWGVRELPAERGRGFTMFRKEPNRPREFQQPLPEVDEYHFIFAS
jgi:hypothetical protein